MRAVCACAQTRTHENAHKLLVDNHSDSPKINLEPSLCFQASVKPCIDELDAITQTPIEAHKQGRICGSRQQGGVTAAR